MFIKKAIALALSLSLTGVLLAGCQSGTPSAKRLAISINQIYLCKLNR